MVQAGAQACQEKPPCLFAYPANQPRTGARRAGQDGKLEAFGSGPSLEGGEGNSSLGRGGLSLPPRAWLGGRTHILEGQEDGQDESTEEERHEQHEDHALAGGEVELQGQDRRQLWGLPRRAAHFWGPPLGSVLARRRRPTWQKPAFLFQEASPDPTFHLSLARDPNLELPSTPIPEALPCPRA